MANIRRQHQSANVMKWGRRAVTAVTLGGLAASLSGLMSVSGQAGASGSVTVSTTKNAKLGTILVSGKTVYTLRPSTTPCTGACLQVWPELLLPKGAKSAKAGNGVSASKLGTSRRSGGALQVTYGGKPLYWFSGDTGPGQANGNVTDAWGKWSAVVTVKPKHARSSSGSSGSGAGTGGASF